MLPDGVNVRFVDGQLRLFGLTLLQPQTREEVIEWARRNRSVIFETRFKELLKLTGAELREDDSAVSLVFDPHLEGEVEDPERWAIAVELEDMFHNMSVTNADPHTPPASAPGQGNHTRNRNSSKVTAHMLKAQRQARLWILPRLKELYSLGWTSESLFGVGRLKYPHGPWGVAFSRNWLREDATFTVTPEGHIKCTWQETTGRVVTQTWRPSV